MRPTRAASPSLLGGQDVPAFLFTASHGLGFPCDHPKQRGRTGALLCQDWPGPRSWHGGIPPQFYFAADDLSPQADLGGLITCHFACFSAGMPAWDSFAHEKAGEPKRLAPAPFVARLPQQLLGKRYGGAAAAMAMSIGRGAFRSHGRAQAPRRRSSTAWSNACSRAFRWAPRCSPSPTAMPSSPAT